jgi:hypothetical protein
MLYMANYQQQHTGYGAHSNSSAVGIDSLTLGKLSCGWPWPFSPIFHRGYGKYKTILLLRLWVIMVSFTLKLPLQAIRVRRSMLQYIMCSTAVVVIGVLTADSAGRTVLW